MRTRPGIRSIVVQALLFCAVMNAGNVFPKRTLFSAGDVFADGVVCAVEIDLGENEVISLREHPRRYVSCKVRIDGKVLERAKVHLKGSGTFQPIDEKPSFTVKVAGLAGLSKLHLNNSVEDATFAQEKLGSELFTAAGIAAPRVGHARVTVNGRDKGLYVLKEGFTPEFLARNFSEGHGRILNSMELKPFLGNESFNVDQFVTFLAMEVLVCHWDGYGLANNNFRVYESSAAGCLTFLPSGMDQLFGNPKSPLEPDMTGPLGRRLLETEEGKARFRRRIAELATRFRGPEMAQRAEEITERLRSSVSRSEFRTIEEAVKDLSGRIRERGSYLQQQNPRIAALSH